MEQNMKLLTVEGSDRERRSREFYKRINRAVRVFGKMGIGTMEASKALRQLRCLIRK